MSTKTIFTPGHFFGNVLAKSSEAQLITLTEASKRPLSPAITVEKTGTGDAEIIVLNCIILISEENMPKDNGTNTIDFDKGITFHIHHLVTDTNKVSIYVSNSGKFVPSTKFYPFVVPIEFKPSEISHLNNTFSSIKVINWDADPEGSRGTETTVKSGVQ